ncbi:unnamed protein product [Wickerhamomyces anomalus]
MPLAEADIPKLKPWLIKRSGELSDAEPDVLADYVIALLNNKVEGDELVKLLEEQLEDFLENSKSFAFEIVNVLSTRAFEEESAKLTGKQPLQQSAQVTQQDLYKPDPTSYRNAPPDYKRKQRRANNFQQQQSTDSTNRQQQRENLKTLISQTEVPNAKHLIVANLPNDKLEEQLLRAYFSRFGAIDNVLIDLTSRIAEVEFANPYSAKKAWSSPVPIFDNRFIKVFFRKKDAENTAEEQKEKEEPFDVDGFKKRQIEKQKEFEERLAKKKIQDAKLKEFIALKEKMLSNYEKELGSLEAQFKAEPEKEAQIKARVDAIQIAMQKDGVTPEAIAADKAKLNGTIPFVPTRGRGRGSARGRGAGAARGRGGFNPYQRPTNASYNRKLDLRTRTVTVKNLSDPKNEEFTKVLESFGDNVSKVANKSPSSVNVTFNDRFHAERFLGEETKLDSVGALEKEWDESVRPSVAPTPPPSTSDNGEPNSSTTADDVEMS